MAESDTATIDALTEWVVGAAVDAYQVLAALGISVPLAVNMSARNLHDLTLPDRLEQRLRAGGMPARHLCLEITESAAFKNAACTMDILSRVRLKGMQLSIDDFGTGYSSLKMLRQMPFTEIKIDQSFVFDAATGEMTVKDLATKKPLTIKTNSDSTMKKLSPMMAAMLARRYAPGAQQGDGADGRGGARGPGGEGRGPGGPGGAGGRGGRGGDIGTMLDNLPAMPLSELKPGDAVMVTTTIGSDPSRVTATMLLAGVEPLLTASPNSTRDIMSGWNLGGGGGGEGQ